MYANQNGSTPQFTNPTASDIPVGKMEFYPLVEYAAMKTPELSVKSVDATYVADARAKFKAGFHFWDKTANEGTGARIAIDKFTFVVLETYSALSGYVEKTAGQPGVSYYTNNVKDSSIEPFSLWQKGTKKPIMSGYYRGKKHEHDTVKLCKRPNTEANEPFNLSPDGHSIVPNGVSFHQHFIIWWVQGERLLELKLTTMISREIKNAVSQAFTRANQRVTPERVNLFKMDKSLWMFNVTSFKRMTKDGQSWNGKGEMYLLPNFECGIVPDKIGDQHNPLFDEMRGLQTMIRDAYENDKESRAKFRKSDGTIDDAAIADATITDDASFPTSEPGTSGGVDSTKRMNTQPPPVDAPAFNGDDLPF